MTFNFERERQIAELAVQRAVLLTRKVLASVDKGALSKEDHTPVSLADFGGQALLVAAIHHAFPDDLIVGEESADELRQNPSMARQVWELVSNTHLDDEASEQLLYSPESLDEMLKLIDIGGVGSGSPSGRMWTMDPVDGTKTFLEGGHYAVCLVLLEDGEEKVAVAGCPHVALSKKVISEAEVDLTGSGYLVSAVRGQGVQTKQLSSGALASAEDVPKRPSGQKRLHELIFTESVEPEKKRSPKRLAIVERLGLPWEPVNIYSTQLRYVALALGFCDVTMRVPASDKYISAIWDHAGGVLMFEEMGGRVTDLTGKRIDFTKGRKLAGNFGILAAPADFHAQILKAVLEVGGDVVDRQVPEENLLD